ncbi:MAG: hypothetical protein AAF562_12790 [Pseudomonadota bacterium]|mgnify:CR=1 FL=1
MRLLQLPLWLAIGLGLAVFLSSINKDIATLLIFGSVFGLVYGGGMAMLKRPSQMGLKQAPAFGRKPFGRYDSALRSSDFAQKTPHRRF